MLQLTLFVFLFAGWAFELVSCPHYLGEMVIYLGLALMLDSRRIIAWLPLIWVVSQTPPFQHFMFRLYTCYCRLDLLFFSPSADVQ